MSFRRGRCRCGHGRDAHQHYRRGADCAMCLCRKWRRPDRVSKLITGWEQENEAEYAAWLTFLGDDDADDLPGMGEAALTTIDSRCRDHPGDAPGLLHVPGCFCLIAVKIKRDDDNGGNGGRAR